MDTYEMMDYEYLRRKCMSHFWWSIILCALGLLTCAINMRFEGWIPTALPGYFLGASVICMLAAYITHPSMEA